MTTRREDNLAEPMELWDAAAEEVSQEPRHRAVPPPWAVLRISPSTRSADLDEFLVRFRPSQWTSDQVSWISVVHGDAQATEDAQAPEGDPQTMVAEWEWVCRHGEPSAKELHRLARKYGVLSGKWMVFCPSAHVDDVWQRIARATAMRQLGVCAKVSPLAKKDDQHVICVYTASYLDGEAVHRLRSGLRELGHTNTLIFKPDVFTCCGIYRGNSWGISASLYAA